MGRNKYMRKSKTTDELAGIFTLTKAQGPGISDVMARLKALDDEIDDGEKRGFMESFLREIVAQKVHDIEETYKKHLEVKRVDIARIMDAAREKYATVESALPSLDRLRLKYAVMDEAELSNALVSYTKTGTPWNPAEVETLALHVKETLGEINFKAMKQAMRENRYAEPWRRLCPEAVQWEAAIRNRRPGEILYETKTPDGKTVVLPETAYEVE